MVYIVNRSQRLTVNANVGKRLSKAGRAKLNVSKETWSQMIETMNQFAENRTQVHALSVCSCHWGMLTGNKGGD